MRALWALVLCAGIGAGCSSVEGAYERDGARAVKDGAAFRFDDPDIAASFAKTAQFRFPARLAVGGIESNRYGNWEDASAADPVSALAEDGTHWSVVMPLPGFLVNGVGGETELRRAAARVQADAVLLYRQEVEFSQGGTVLSVLNLLIVPTVLVPTVTREATVRTTAAVVDVRNGLVCATAQDTRRDSGMSPSAFVEGGAREMKKRLREEAFAALREQLGKQLDRLPAGP